MNSFLENQTNNSIIENDPSKELVFKTIVDTILRKISNDKDFEGYNFINAINQYVWNNNLLRTCLFFSNIGVLIYLLYVFTYKGLYRFCLFSIKRGKRAYRRFKSNWEDFKLNSGQRILNQLPSIIRWRQVPNKEVITLDNIPNTSSLFSNNDLPFIDSI